MAIRVYLGAPLTLALESQMMTQADFPGRQGRLAFAYLVIHRLRPVPCEELAGLLWQDSLPRAWNTALRSLISKLRIGLASIGIENPGQLLISRGSSYQFQLPPDGWIDHEAAADGLHGAEVALRESDFQGACGWALVASQISAHPFLPTEEVPWVNQQREWLRGIRVRALEALSHVWLASGDVVLAIRDAGEVIRLEREAAYQTLMRAHAAAGNRAEALRVYERLRALLSGELGVDPSPQTRAVHSELLRSK